jgi:hypothetical protein
MMGRLRMTGVYADSFNNHARPVPCGVLYSCSECAETVFRPSHSRRNEFNVELPFQHAGRLVEGSEGN